ncbi:hypothetical protein M3Y94_00958900 [Aphelenchoides besseyi]|nr:hypothetical protein M3Y94_00958900 [Aphelenchoides besseyi]KAI6224736.1 hypothetical protein M3Y95_00784000 [Aphelenchoides besseyi]
MPIEITRSDLYTNYDTFLFDADGVLWLGTNAIVGAVDAIQQLLDAGKRVLIVTNNSTSTPDQFTDKFQRLGFKSLTGANIVSSAYVAMDVLGKNAKKSELPIYLIGTPALAQMLESVGVKSIGVGADHLENYGTSVFLMSIPMEEKVFAVVTSFDSHFNYVKLTKAVNYLNDPNVQFYTTNEDLTYPGSDPNFVVPGAGSSAVPVRAVSGRTPMVFGKPQAAMFEYIQQRFNIDPKRTLMVGDRLDTDIEFGNRNQLDTLLVLSGVHNLAHVQKAQAEGQTDQLPRFFASSVSVFVE